MDMLEGKLHLLSKDQVAEIDRQSLMPKVALTSNEMRDLVSYLSKTRGVSRMPRRGLAITSDVGPGIPFTEVAKPEGRKLADLPPWEPERQSL